MVEGSNPSRPTIFTKSAVLLWHFTLTPIISVLTGQNYRYRLGKFIRPELMGSSPAWELGLRLSWTDLNDGDVQGGEQRNAGFALNVYPRPNIRGQLNLIQVNSDRQGGDGLLLQARIQLNW